MKKYLIRDDKTIELIESPYQGIIYRYGRVQLIEDGDVLRIQFDYHIEHLPDPEMIPNRGDFIQYIGPILSELIDEGVHMNSLVYTGGT